MRVSIGVIVLVLVELAAVPGFAAAPTEAVGRFEKEVRPLLEKYCFECHGDGVDKGGLALDEMKGEEALLRRPEVWFKVLKNVRAGIMPPRKKKQPTEAEKEILAGWIKTGAFGIDLAHPDPGRVTVRRLNRVEYRNTIRDLMGIEFNSLEEFPPDDTGYGFDTIGAVLSVSPLLLEKYMSAAETIVTRAVPTVPKVVSETTIAGKESRGKEEKQGAERLSLYKPATVSSSFSAPQAGSYRFALGLNVRGEFDFDPGRCWVVLRLDGEEIWHEELGWGAAKRHNFDLPQKMEAGKHELTFELWPLVPVAKKVNNLDLQITSVRIEGPTEPEHWVAPKNYHRFFPREAPPEGTPERRAYAREVLAAFAGKAFRRPVDERMVERLTNMAEAGYSQKGKRFEEGVAQAMVAVLSSPRFLFRIEEGAAGTAELPYGPVDEYALASRLSYFLWSTMPDEELMRLAERGELRKNLAAQVKRLVEDPRSREFVENFVGQWVQGRDVEGISIDARTVLARDKGEEKELERLQAEFRARLAQQQVQAKTGQPAPALTKEQQAENEKRRQQFRKLFQPAVELDGPLRDAMRREPEMFFAGIVHEDRSVAEMLDSDYTYLNERLAKHYGVQGVKGPEMRRVKLSENSPRGGFLTMGSVLVVTSNPTRTSPVKRGQFILDNVLGMPSPPPPADVPALEDSEKGIKDHEPTMREALAIHREKPLCSSCHSRMDPLGLSLENFNAMGMWREKERGQAVDASGQLITGESFANARELKKILKERHLREFYRCLTEKVMTYALGRGLEYYDVQSVDRIVANLEKNDGRFSALLMGVVESTPFQERRNGVNDDGGGRRLQAKVQP